MSTTTDATPEGQRRARNRLREMLWADDAFAHRWLCHEGQACTDGCDAAGSPERVRFYQSGIEVPPCSPLCSVDFGHHVSCPKVTTPR